MADIFHTFPIKSSIDQVFDAISLSQGLDQWWTKNSKDDRQQGGIYELGFGPGYEWKAEVTQCKLQEVFELTMTRAEHDWLGTKIGFRLESKDDYTSVNFYHIGWPERNEHYTISCYCWAMYLRILKRYLEFGERVSYEDRLEV